jgi:hypothetical protein
MATSQPTNSYWGEVDCWRKQRGKVGKVAHLLGGQGNVDGFVLGVGELEDGLLPNHRQYSHPLEINLQLGSCILCESVRMKINSIKLGIMWHTRLRTIDFL